MNRTIKKHFQEHATLVDACFHSAAGLLDAAAGEIASCFLNGGKLYICGSGISSITAYYAAAVFINRCRMPRPPLPAIYLTADASMMSASGDSMNEIFEKQIAALAAPHDIVWGITADNSAESVIRGLRAAAYNNIKTIAFSGKENNSLQGVSDIFISANAQDTIRAREIHLLMINIICDRVDEIMFKPGYAAAGQADRDSDA